MMQKRKHLQPILTGILLETRLERWIVNKSSEIKINNISRKALRRKHTSMGNDQCM